MIRKEITFIYLDAVQKQVYEMIAAEAEKRGYVTRLTDDKFAKCEIGWYCEHNNFPQFSKFSVIMLHDITQQYGNWPDIWIREPWNKYDIGFLPSKVWVDNWNKCSQYYYANPRKGMYLAGWPKADRLAEYLDEEKKEAYKRKVGIDSNKPTILYAPAWENDGKQDEFVQAMLPLDVNILVKQPPWADKYVEQLKNIAEMRELHKDNSRVVQLNPKTSILDAIMISDILVSEESSTMCESVMLGKPAISVSNWLIPDTTPSRFPADDYDYVIKTKKEDLTECVRNILENYENFSIEAQKYSDTHFENIGKCIPLMMDILDAHINEQAQVVIIQKLKRKPKERVPLKKLGFHLLEQVRRNIENNYIIRYKVVRCLWLCCRNVVRLCKGKKPIKIEQCINAVNE